MKGKMKGIMKGIGILCIALFLVGCMQEVTLDDYKECNEGRYKADDIINRLAEELGGDLDYVDIYSVQDNCYIDLVFKENLNTIFFSGKRVNLYDII